MTLNPSNQPPERDHEDSEEHGPSNGPGEPGPRPGRHYFPSGPGQDRGRRRRDAEN